jgi:hypothetical protein
MTMISTARPAIFSASLRLERASLLVSHKRPMNWLYNPITMKWDIPDPESYAAVDDDEVVWNQKTNVGIVQLHTQGYGTSGLLTNGFNYIALTNTAVSPAAA